MDVKVEVQKEDIVVRLPHPARSISTLPCGGLKEVKEFVFHTVPKDFKDDVLKTYREVTDYLGLKFDEAILFLTAVPVPEKYVEIHGSGEGFEALVVATVGLGNPVSIPNGGTYARGSTVNILVVVDRGLSDGALTELIKTVTEAKVAALHDVDLTCGWNVAVGTCTDAVAVASLGEGDVAYAGVLTPVGSLVSGLVYKAVIDGARKFGYLPGRPMLERLKERGITIEGMLDSAGKLLTLPEGMERESALNSVREKLLDSLEDVNVCSMIEAGLRLEEDLRKGLVPGMRPGEYLEDPVRLVSDEILGMGLSVYLNGWKALFELYRYDSLKPGILGELPPIMDDLIAALIAGATSRFYDEICKGDSFGHKRVSKEGGKGS